MERCIAKFTATEADGTKHTISVIQGFHEIVGEPGHTRITPNQLREMRTEDGRFVQPCGWRRYEIVDGTERIPLTSADPNAPDFQGGEELNSDRPPCH